jgi:plasmid stability protein
VERLRKRAASHHRSLQGELLAIIDASARQEGRMMPEAALVRIRRSGLRTWSESAALLVFHKLGDKKSSARRLDGMAPEGVTRR